MKVCEPLLYTDNMSLFW